MGTEKQNEWYFFSHKDKKYPTGNRTNRATRAGFWKVTGRDKAIYLAHNNLIGMRKTLVFYQGRAPSRQKSDWLMHEYKLETNENGNPQEEGWVVCRVFKKRMLTTQKEYEHEPLNNWYNVQVPFVQYFNSYLHQYPCKQELQLNYNNLPHNYPFLQLPQLESIPKVAQYSSATTAGSTLLSSIILSQKERLQKCNSQMDMQILHNYINNINEQAAANDQLTDWTELDKFVASLLSQENSTKESTYSTQTSIWLA